MKKQLLEIIFLVNIKKNNFSNQTNIKVKNFFFFKNIFKFSVFLFYMFKNKPKTNFKKLLKDFFGLTTLYL